jgi:hypothetical protein
LLTPTYAEPGEDGLAAVRHTLVRKYHAVIC